MKTVPAFFQHRLSLMAGRNPYGQPKLRVCWAPETRHEQGILKGALKYVDATNPKKSLVCWVLESWLPPEMFAGDWNERILGPFPSRGMYGCLAPLVIYMPNGDIVSVDLTESVLESVQKLYHDSIAFAALNPGARYAQLVESQVVAEAQDQAEIDKKDDDLFDYVVAHEESINNDDNRVFSLPKELDVVTSGGKMPARS